MTARAQFAVRLARDIDISALGSLIEQSVRQLQISDYSPAQIDASIGSVFGIDRQLVADQTYFVAASVEDPETPLACGGWSYRRTLYGSDHYTERDSAILNPARDFAKIRAIFVHPSWARRGLGSLILDRCEAAAVAAGFSRFEMGSTLTGVSLYTRKGYTVRNRAWVSLPNGERMEIVVMDKTIQQ